MNTVRTTDKKTLERRVGKALPRRRRRPSSSSLAEVDDRLARMPHQAGAGVSQVLDGPGLGRCMPSPPSTSLGGHDEYFR